MCKARTEHSLADAIFGIGLIRFSWLLWLELNLHKLTTLHLARVGGQNQKHLKWLLRRPKTSFPDSLTCREEKWLWGVTVGYPLPKGCSCKILIWGLGTSSSITTYYIFFFNYFHPGIFNKLKFNCLFTTLKFSNVIPAFGKSILNI